MTFRMKKSIENEKGLTLIEVLVVVFIISIILAIVVPNYTQSSARAQEKICYANQKLIEAQLELYEIDTGDKYSDVEDNTSFLELIENGYLKEEPSCPSKGEYTITYVDPKTGQPSNKADSIPKVSCNKHGHHKDET